MRILYIHNEYGLHSGEETAAEAIAKLLTDRGHSVSWMRRSSQEILDSPAGHAKAFFTGIHNPFAARALAQRLDEMRPDLVQVQNLYPLLSSAIFRPIRMRRIPIVMRCPNYRLFCPNGRHLTRGRVCEKCLSAGREFWCILHNCEGGLAKSAGYALRNAWARVTRAIVRSVDVFIVQSEFQRDKFIRNGIPPERIEILPGVAPAIDVAGDDEPGECVTFVGRVSAEKGVDVFLQAAGRLSDIPFAIAGDGTHSLKYRRAAPPNVTWHGFLRDRALGDVYRRSRIVVVPSRWFEGFPNVVAAAMAWGRPVVAARIGALTSIVEDGRTGLHFDPNDDSDLARKLRDLYGNVALCRTLGRNARATVRDRYLPERVYETLMRIYDKAVRLSAEKAAGHL